MSFKGSLNVDNKKHKEVYGRVAEYQASWFVTT